MFRLQLTNLQSQLTNLRLQLTNLRLQLTNLRLQLTNLRSQLNNLRSHLKQAYKPYVLDMPVDSRSVNKDGWCFFLITFLVFLKVSDGWALPNDLPTIRNINGNHERNDLIKQYFQLGCNYSEIMPFLPLRHGVHSSLRQLKRIQRSRGP